MPMAWKPWRVCWTFQQTLPSKIWPFSLAAHQLLSWLWKHSKGMIHYDIVILNFQLKHSRDKIKDLCNIVVHVYLSLKIRSLFVIYLIRTYCFKSYEDEFKSKSGTEMDFTSPMFQATALCAACRWEKKEQIQLHLKYILRQSFLQGWFSNRHWKELPLSNLYLFYYNRKLKLKIDWNKLRELCSIKRSTYDKLVAEMEIHAVKLLGK